MKKNEEKNSEYQDYMIINNTQLLNESVELIRKAAEIHNFIEIIDFRANLTWYGFTHKTSANRIVRNTFRIYKIINYNSRIKVLIQRLCDFFQNKGIDEIYMRYKLNFPEQVLLTTFNKADIYLFEDGLGDYLPKTYQSKKEIKNNSMQSFHIKKMINGLLIKLQFPRLKQEDDLYKRVKGVYELVKGHKGYRIQHLQKHIKISVHSIKNEYIDFIKLSYEKLSVKVTKKPFVLLLPSFFSAGYLWYPGREGILISEDIEYTRDIVSAIKISYPDLDIIIKTHPRTPQALRETFQSKFIDDVCKVESSEVLPAEAYFINHHLQVVVAGSYSSSLMYATQVFNKKAYYCRPPKHLEWSYPEGSICVIEKILEKLGVKKMEMNDRKIAA